MTAVIYIYTRIHKRIRRGGLTPASCAAHDRNGGECRKIEVVRATVMPNGVAKKFTAAWFGQVVDQVKNKRTLRYTLHLTQTYSRSTLFAECIV